MSRVGGLILQAVLAVAIIVSLVVPGWQVATPYLTAAFAAVGVGNALLFPPEMPKLPKPADGQLVTAQALPPRVRGYGRARLGGAYALRETSDGVLYQHVMMHHGRVDGFEDIYLHDEVVTLGTDIKGKPNSVMEPEHFTKGSFAFNPSASPPEDIVGRVSYVQIETRLGLVPETPVQWLVDAFPFWTANHRGDGIAQISVVAYRENAERFAKRFPNGVPIPSAVMRLCRIYDPRETAASPPQSRDDPETWTWSQNAALCLMDFLAHEDGARLDFNRRILPAISEWVAAANICDEQVPLKAGGTEDRYHYDGIYRLTDRPADVIFSMKSVMDAWIYERPDGAIGIHCGKYVAPTVTIAAKHIIGVQVRQNRKVEEVINEIRASFTSPAHDFGEQDAPAWRDEADISRRGQTLSATLDLTRCQQFGQVRRLMKRAMARQRVAVKGRIVTDAYGIVARGERYLTIDLAPFGFGQRIVEVVGYVLSLESLSATIDWVDADPLIDEWDAATEEGDAPPVPESEDTDDKLEIPEAVIESVAPSTYSSGGGSVGVQLAITITDPDRDDLLPSIQYRPLGEMTWRYEPVAEDATDGTNYVHLTAPVMDGQTYEVQARFEAGGGVRGEWMPDPPDQVTADASVAPVATLITQEGDTIVDELGNELVTN